MNYAEDRLDRRTRNKDSINSLYTDYTIGIQTKNNELLGRTLRDIGWNYHSIYHYGQQVVLTPKLSSSSISSVSSSSSSSISTAIGDYAQILDLAGYTDISCIVLLTYYHQIITKQQQQQQCTRNSTNANDDNDVNFNCLSTATPAVATTNSPEEEASLHNTTIDNNQAETEFYQQKQQEQQQHQQHDESWILQNPPPVNIDCGCGSNKCSIHSTSNNCFIPFTESECNPIIESIIEFYKNFLLENNNNIITTTIKNESVDANEILRRLGIYRNNCCSVTGVQQQQHYQQQQQNCKPNNNNNNGTHKYKSKIINNIESKRFMMKNNKDIDWQEFDFLQLHNIPKVLQFWVPSTSTTVSENNSNTTTTTSDTFSSLLQILLVKFLYITFPTLSIYAVVGMTYRSTIDRNYLNEQYMSKYYKSHWSYFIFLRSIILGERIKPQRKQLQHYTHTPIWDTMLGIDTTTTTNNNQHHNTCTKPNDVTKMNILSCCDSIEKILYCMKRKMFQRPLVSNPLQWIHPNPIINNINRPLFIVGDSHVLSLSWQTISISSSSNGTTCRTYNKDYNDSKNHQQQIRIQRALVPIIVTGLKAWHIQKLTRFFTYTTFKEMLQRIVGTTINTNTASCTSPRTIILSAGEIDCREGMGGPLLEGYKVTCHDRVRTTVHTYIYGILEWLNNQQEQQQTNDNYSSSSIIIEQVLIMPVAPHTQFKTTGGRIAGQLSRRETMRIWNLELRKLLPLQNKIFLLDYWEHLVAEVVSSSVEVASIPPDIDVGSPGNTVDNNNDHDETKVMDTDNGNNNNGQTKQDLDTVHPAPPSPPPYTLHRDFNADTTHMNNAFLPLFKKAIQECGCNLQLL